MTRCKFRPGTQTFDGRFSTLQMTDKTQMPEFEIKDTKDTPTSGTQSYPDKS